MIKLISRLPEITAPNAEYLKIKCLFDCYSGDPDLLFWTQDGGRAYISLSGGDMTVFNKNGDLEEIREFISVLTPDSIFGDYDTLAALEPDNAEPLNVLSKKANIKGETAGDSLSSKEIYEILNIPQFVLPDYPYFAVDFCRRKNRGCADYYGIKEKCAAVSINSGNFALLSGIVSREKGYGTRALTAIIQKNYGREILVCCRENVKEFYLKNGFKQIYKAGTWYKNEHK